MVKVFRYSCLPSKARDFPEDVYFADENAVSADVKEGHLFVYGDMGKLLYVCAPDSWTRAQIL